MRKSRLTAACLACLLVLGLAAIAGPTGQSEDHPAVAQNSGQTIGLLDVGYIYKHYPRFTAMLAEMKTDVQAAEAEAKKKKEALEGLQKELRLHAVGTPQYAALEKRIAMAQAELAGSVATQKKVFVRREARLYYDTYQEISQVVQEYARANNIALVLRISDDPVNVNEPKDVLGRINRQVVWHDQSRDLTRIILQRLGDKPEDPQEGDDSTPSPADSEQENHHGESHRASHSG